MPKKYFKSDNGESPLLIEVKEAGHPLMEWVEESEWIEISAEEYHKIEKEIKAETIGQIGIDHTPTHAKIKNYPAIHNNKE